MNYVIDTNVLVAANGHATHLSGNEELICINFLSQVIQNQDCISWDSSMLIYKEYNTKCNHSGNSGVGDKFFRWLFQNQGVTSICEFVEITENGETFEEFPDDLELHGFDISDRKFVAVAIKSNFKPMIVNATDFDWHEYREPLSKYVQVHQICPHIFL